MTETEDLPSIDIANGDMYSEEKDSLPPKTSFYYLSNLILALLCSFTMCGLLYITVKATRIVWHHDKVIPMMLVFLNLSLLGGTAFFSWSLIRVYSHPWKTENSSAEQCESTIFPYLPVVFLTCAVLLNVNKWVYCLMHINFHSKAAVENTHDDPNKV